MILCWCGARSLCLCVCGLWSGVCVVCAPHRIHNPFSSSARHHHSPTHTQHRTLANASGRARATCSPRRTSAPHTARLHSESPSVLQRSVVSSPPPQHALVGPVRRRGVISVFVLVRFRVVVCCARRFRTRARARRSLFSQDSRDEHAAQNTHEIYTHARNAHNKDRRRARHRFSVYTRRACFELMYYYRYNIACMIM